MGLLWFLELLCTPSRVLVVEVIWANGVNRVNVVNKIIRVIGVINFIGVRRLFIGIPS